MEQQRGGPSGEKVQGVTSGAGRGEGTVKGPVERPGREEDTRKGPRQGSGGRRVSGVTVNGRGKPDRDRGGLAERGPWGPFKKEV